jgi:hypothetical protein
MEMELYAMEEAASRNLLIKSFKNLQEKSLKCNSSLLYGILFYLYPYVSYMTMAEWDYRNMFVGKYISGRTVIRCCVCVDFKTFPD